MMSWLPVWMLLAAMSTSYSEEVMDVPGDVIIGGLLTVYDASCQTPHAASIEVAEAIRWMTSQLNVRHFLPNITIGLRVLATCGQAERATRQALKLLEVPNLIGILGPASSSETVYVTRVLASLPLQERPPVVSTSATAAKVAEDAKKAGNFFRVISHDNIQVEVMAQLLTLLQWNYVALVYEDSVYGTEGAAGLRVRLEQSGAACVAVFEAIPVSDTDRQKENRIGQILEKVKTAQISGMVLFTSGDVTRDILRSVQDSGLNYVEFILSEAISLMASRLRDTAGRTLSAARGSLITTPPYRPNLAFSRHWRALLSNQTALQQASEENPWLRGLVVPGFESQAQLLFSSYAMHGVLALAEAVKLVHMRRCGGRPGLCQAMQNVSREDLVQEMRNVTLNLSEVTFDPQKTGILTFDKYGEAVPVESSDEPLYQVFNFLETEDFVEVGSFQGGVLMLNKSRGRVYPEAGGGVTLSQATPAQCPQGKDCVQCLPQHLHDEVLHVPGEHYVVAVVPINDKEQGQPLQCGALRSAISVDLAEAALFAVNKVNQRQGMFQSLLQGKLGLLVINSCNAPLVLERKLLALHAGTLSLGEGRNSSEVASKVIGYVGALGSSVSIGMAKVLADLGYVQISPSSTNDQLSDRETYKYFLRLVPPDIQQTEAMLDIIKKVGANYIQIIYSEELYGRGARDAILRVAPGKGVCVASAIGVTETTESLNRVKDELLRKPFAKLVVIIVRSHLIEPVLKRLHETGSLQKYQWLGSETWGSRTSLLSFSGVLGAVSLVHRASPLAELETHIRDQNLSITPDPWLRTFWETRLDCFLPGSFRRKSGKACPVDFSRGTPGQYIQDIWAPYIVNAVYALVKGWDTALRDKCGASSVARVCPELTPGDVYTHVREVNLDLRLHGQFLRLFDDNGDGTGGYDVNHIVRKDGNLVYESMGTWTREAGLTTRLNMQVDSRCPNTEECRPCTSTPSESSSADNADPGSCLPPVVGLGASLLVLVIALVISVVCLKRTQRDLAASRKAAAERIYDEPGYLQLNSCDLPPPRPCFRTFPFQVDKMTT